MARAGCKYIKAPDRSEFKNGADGEEEDTDGEGFSFTRTFPVGKWASLPRHMELPEPEYLAKARPNFVPLTGFIGADKDGFVATKDRVEGMRKVHVKQVDAGTGKAWLYKTIVPEGYVVEGELANGDPQTEQQESAEDVAIATPAPGTVIGGIGVVNSKGVLVANIDEPLVTPQSRPRVPTKRRMRGGPGRGKKKRVMFAHETHGHEQVDMPVTSASTPLSVAPTAFASPAAVLPEASLASPSQRVSRHAHDAEEATNSDARGSHPADEEESDAVMAGAPLTSMTDLSLSSQHGQQLSDTKPSSEPTAKGYGEASSEQDFDSSSGHMLDAQPRSTVDAQRPEPARDEGSQAITATDQEGTATLNRSAVDLITDQTSELNNSANNISLSPSTSAADERTKVSQASAAQLHVRIQETSASVIDSSHMLSKHEDRASHATTPAAMPIERCPSQSMAVACEGGPGCASHSDSADTIAEQQKSITTQADISRLTHIRHLSAEP
ncbi:hypothetical protein KEM52_001808 [Ascosphaera acerosa]|nr:hypothetical protein KEM52_001808 [Ascosphaera acerosa]